MTLGARSFFRLTAVALLSPLAVLASSWSTDIQQSWDHASFSLSGDDQKAAMQALVQTCSASIAEHPKDAALLTWCGITNSSYAGMAGSLSAMKYAKAAKAMLESAISLAPEASKGAAETSLGTLYFKVPGWPIGFGNDDKAGELLEAGLALNLEGIDAHFFYADYLLEQKDRQAAREHFEAALNAPDRPGREAADAVRRKEILERLADITSQ